MDFSIGFYRGQVYIPIPHSDGSISGFVGYADGQMKLPPKWLPATSNVLTFSKKSALKKALARHLSKSRRREQSTEEDCLRSRATTVIRATKYLLGRQCAHYLVPLQC